MNSGVLVAAILMSSALGLAAPVPPDPAAPLAGKWVGVFPVGSTRIDITFTFRAGVKPSPTMIMRGV